MNSLDRISDAILSGQSYQRSMINNSNTDMKSGTEKELLELYGSEWSEMIKQGVLTKQYSHPLILPKDILWSTVNPLPHVAAKSSTGSVIAIKTDKGGETNFLALQIDFTSFLSSFFVVYNKTGQTGQIGRGDSISKSFGKKRLINESSTNKYDHLKDMQKNFEHCLNPNQIIVDTNLLLQWSEFNSIADLERLGMERLKTELQIRGMKCGGTLHERVSRLFLLKNSRVEDLPKHCFPQQKHSEIVS
ncbi:hypothetical protein RFI_04438 [Reticulomyxa filosa]|uniref:SDE2/SF3A3 SAP domain-containing protein n=1 Tax=Reticulomyxa filosa TaxID=46433 RepID=X6P3H4_RETFI|nr:hypothetical protein RFI_04438 [Reticulomyxa filosa]|eukprot:ETO32678.1 hypothetical protein RFI_04438 [Reticulomyxa filosa]